MNKKFQTRAYVVTAVSSAFAFLLQLLGNVVGFKVAGFLEVELSDIPPLVVSFAYGPFFGLTCELVKNLLHCLVTTTGFVGEFANFITNGVFVLTAGMFYKYNRTRKGALIGMLTGVVIMTLASIASNLFIMFPLYMPSVPFSAKLSLALKIVTPFNIAKGIVISIITYLLYKRITPILKGK